jgi:predicted Fe-Mo cluster-binding NifX family protein
MKIAIAASTADIHGGISHRGARADCYLVFDEARTLHGVIQNPFKDYDRAVGIRVADYLAEKGISGVVAAHLGRGFTTALDAKGIRHAESEGSIDEVAKKLGNFFGAA